VPGPNHAVLNRRPPPPGLVAAAEQDYHTMRDELAALIPIVQALLAGDLSEVEVVTDVWLTLRVQDPRAATLLGAVAVVQLAKGEAPYA
jgi:hypothetical protein